MRRTLRAARFFARDRAGRTAALAAAGAALLVPRALLLGSAGPGAAGFRAGLEAGAAPGSLAGLWGVLLAAGVLVLWQGVVSSDLEGGRFRTTLVRPLWRPGVYLARHGAALCLLVLAASSVWSLIRVTGGAGALGPGDVVLAALVSGWSLGALLLLLSSLLDRGDVLAAVALFLAPAALHGTAPAGGAAGIAAGLASLLLPPMVPLRDLRHGLAAGGAPEAGQLLVPLTYGAVALGLALLRLGTREYRGR